MRYFESLVTVALAASLLGAPPALAQAPAAAPAAPGATAAAPAPATADAERTTEAARRFERGLAFYRDGEYRLAQIEFDRAYELVPDYRVLYNIGQVSIQLAQYARARRALARYLAEGGAEVSEERAAAVQADLEMLAQRTAFVTVEVSVAGAEILVDDEPVGVAPLPEPLLVDAGRHAVAARHGQSTSAAQYVTVAGGDSITVQIELVRPVPAEPVTVPPPVAPVAVAAAPSAAPRRRARAVPAVVARVDRHPGSWPRAPSSPSRSATRPRACTRSRRRSQPLATSSTRAIGGRWASSTLPRCSRRAPRWRAASRST
jgi:hypothetical protein